MIATHMLSFSSYINQIELLPRISPVSPSNEDALISIHLTEVKWNTLLHFHSALIHRKTHHHCGFDAKI